MGLSHGGYVPSHVFCTILLMSIAVVAHGSVLNIIRSFLKISNTGCTLVASEQLSQLGGVVSDLLSSLPCPFWMTAADPWMPELSCRLILFASRPSPPRMHENIMDSDTPGVNYPGKRSYRAVRSPGTALPGYVTAPNTRSAASVMTVSCLLVAQPLTDGEPTTELAGVPFFCS